MTFEQHMNQLNDRAKLMNELAAVRRELISIQGDLTIAIDNLINLTQREIEKYEGGQSPPAWLLKLNLDLDSAKYRRVQ